MKQNHTLVRYNEAVANPELSVPGLAFDTSSRLPVSADNYSDSYYAARNFFINAFGLHSPKIFRLNEQSEFPILHCPLPLRHQDKQWRQLFSGLILKNHSFDVSTVKRACEGQVRRFTPEAAWRPLAARLKDMPFRPDSFKYDRAVAVEFEMFGQTPKGNCICDYLNSVLPVWTRAKSDGSIRPSADCQPVEVAALFVRREMEVRLHRLCRQLEQLGMRVNKSCGLHVHFDMRGRTIDEVLAIAKRTDKWLFALRYLVPQSRRENSYCQFGVVTKRTYERQMSDSRYRAVNVCSFSRHKTLEIRLHSGTVDYTKVLSWIRLCELVMSMPSNPKSQDTLAALNSLPMPEHDRAYWRSRHQALNPHLYATPVDAGSAEQE